MLFLSHIHLPLFFLDDRAKMAEFAEESLEKLLPAFESIKASKLFTVDEFSAFVQQCSRFEYRLQKRVGFLLKCFIDGELTLGVYSLC